MNTQLHFIIGIGRSGTTILSKLLNKYTDVHCMPEANFLVFFLQKYRHKTHFTPDEIDAVFEEIELYTLSHPLVGWTFVINEAKRAIAKSLKQSNVSYQELCTLIYRNFKVSGINKDKATLFIDKNPSYTIFVNEIANALPDSKFIFIIRDYRANILSRKQSVYLKSPDIAYNATRWKLYNEEAFRFYQKNKNKVLLIKYEDLVSNYEQEIPRLTNFLKIAPELEKTDSSSQPPIDINDYKIAERFKERFIKKYSDLNKDLNRDRLDVWKEKLNEQEIRLCDAICSGIAKEFGYESFYTLRPYSSFFIKLRSIVPIIKGYLDIYKDKLIYYAPIKIKLTRLRKRYIKLGFLKN